jgi:hypothetical protein
MSNNKKFPPSVEIKQAIAAAERASIKIGSVEIRPSKITIHARSLKDMEPPAELSYAEWKAKEQGQPVKQAGAKSDALQSKSTS